MFPISVCFLRDKNQKNPIVMILLDAICEPGIINDMMMLIVAIMDCAKDYGANKVVPVNPEERYADVGEGHISVTTTLSFPREEDFMEFLNEIKDLLVP